MSDWHTPELRAVYDPTRVPQPTPEDPAEWSRVSRAELQVRQQRIQEHRHELAAQGVLMLRYTAAGQLRYFSVDQPRAERLLRQRFGADVELRYLAATLRALRGQPFGSWHADGLTLHVFYGLPHNGERFGGCLVAEDNDCMIVSLMIVDWLGNKTLIGGFTPTHATVTLQAELGDRAVIDNFDNHARPHWKTAAEVPLPRPQDL